MLQIQLGHERPVDPANDWLERSRVGSWPGMSEEQAWITGRGVWVFNTDRALRQDEVQIVDPSGTVLAVARIDGITKCGDRHYALEGSLLLGDPRVGNPTPTPHPSRNAVAYFDDSPRLRR
ncbi:hypothetical protein [Amycolatopsis sp. H20-H5]|uniref:hypothetical protein n=1 Tax=Amycolatopsis sp. H20-H5 TaxID=3046309 RepID=UPI002DB93018|nr:hypothetical protein [Amycolatopsis sp. H20-H5]MEC3974237.1 hypothetical protein [Amycolatopsis sp. H20-H5]